MLYLKKLALVAVLAVASVIWFPVLACRGVFAIVNWLGRLIMGGFRHRDSGVKLLASVGIVLFGLPWGVAIGAILALASYEIMCFKLMNVLFSCEDIGFHPQGGEPQNPRRGPAPQAQARSEARVHQLPNANQVLSEVQAQQVSLRNTWNPLEMDYTWDSRRQAWRSKDMQLVDLTGAHIAWAQ